MEAHHDTNSATPLPYGLGCAVCWLRDWLVWGRVKYLYRTTLLLSFPPCLSSFLLSSSFFLLVGFMRGCFGKGSNNPTERHSCSRFLHVYSSSSSLRPSSFWLRLMTGCFGSGQTPPHSDTTVLVSYACSSYTSSQP